jgi:hypothetical protein
MSAKAKIILGRVLAGAGAVSWLTFIETYIYFDHTRPHALDVPAGRLFALNNHGSIAYLTHGEHLFLYSFAWVAGLFFVAAVFLHRSGNSRRLT